MRTSQERKFRRAARKWLGTSRIVTVILDDGWFRLILLACLLALGCVIVLLPDYWITTPKGMLPARRLSFWDMIAAHSLNVRAQAESATGDIHTAARTWQMARQRNPGNLEVIRGAIRNLLTMQDSLIENRTDALALATWLVRASQSHLSDVVLATRIFEKFKAPEQIVEVTDSKLLRESTDLIATRYAALLRLGRALQVQQELTALPSSVKGHADAQLFQSALSALLDAPDAGVATGRLRTAAHGARGSGLATLLLCWVGLHQEDIVTAKEALRQLVDISRDDPQDHVALWNLLLKKGYAVEASKLANERVPDPLTGTEAFQLVGALTSLDRVDLATQVLQRELPRHNQSLELWILMAEILARTKDWHALRATALQLRERLAENRNAAALSHLMEAQSFTGLKLLGDADMSLRQLKEGTLNNPTLALYAGRVLEQIGAHTMVENILRPFQAALERDPSYWSLLFDAGFATKSTDLVLSSSKRAMELEPNKQESINRRATALIVAREAPQEALQLAQRLKSLHPTATATTINLAQACLLNSRREEASRLLKEIEPRNLTPDESNPYWLASVELALLENDLIKSKQCLSQLRTNELFPNQARWLDEASQRLKN